MNDHGMMAMAKQRQEDFQRQASLHRQMRTGKSESHRRFRTIRTSRFRWLLGRRESRPGEWSPSSGPEIA
jgi:hypothetical protein